LRRDSPLARAATVEVDGAEKRFLVELSICKIVVGFGDDTLSSPNIILFFWWTWNENCSNWDQTILSTKWNLIETQTSISIYKRLRPRKKIRNRKKKEPQKQFF
jgi:hypothetical protein